MRARIAPKETRSQVADGRRPSRISLVSTTSAYERGCVGERVLTSDVAQVPGFVGQRARMGLRSFCDQPGRCSHLTVLVELRISAAIHPDGRLQHPIGEVEAQELSLVQRATHDELVPLTHMADVLELEVVLI